MKHDARRTLAELVGNVEITPTVLFYILSREVNPEVFSQEVLLTFDDLKQLTGIQTLHGDIENYIQALTTVCTTDVYNTDLESMLYLSNTFVHGDPYVGADTDNDEILGTLIESDLVVFSLFDPPEEYSKSVYNIRHILDSLLQTSKDFQEDSWTAHMLYISNCRSQLKTLDVPEAEISSFIIGLTTLSKRLLQGLLVEQPSP
jgi:hypothetical protein